MPFRKTRVPEIAETAPEPEALSASQRLNALLTEQDAINATLAEHREMRQAWLADGGDLDRIVQLGSEDSALKLRAEQLAALLPAAQEAVQRERMAQRDAQWQQLAPDLDQAQLDTLTAIRAYNEASNRYRKLHWQAEQAGYGPELREQFVTPPHAQVNPWVLQTFIAAVEQCWQRRATVQAMATAPAVTFEVEGLFDGPAVERFVPKRVDPQEIEAIGVLAPPVAIRVVHGPLRTAHLNFGVARMHAGERHYVPARAAHLLIASGCAERADEAAPVTAA